MAIREKFCTKVSTCQYVSQSFICGCVCGEVKEQRTQLGPTKNLSRDTAFKEHESAAQKRIQKHLNKVFQFHDMGVSRCVK